MQFLLPSVCFVSVTHCWQSVDKIESIIKIGIGPFTGQLSREASNVHDSPC